MEKIGAVPKIGSGKSIGGDTDIDDPSGFSKLSKFQIIQKGIKFQVFEVPDKFDISFKRMNPDGDSEGWS